MQVAVLLHRLARVDPDAQADGHVGVGELGLDAALHRDGALDGGTGHGELGHEGVADLVHDAPRVLIDSGLEDGVVLAHDLAHAGVLELGEKRGRGNHVCKQDGAKRSGD